MGAQLVRDERCVAAWAIAGFRMRGACLTVGRLRSMGAAGVLAGNDLNEDITPVEAGLTWTIGKSRRDACDFLGGEVPPRCPVVLAHRPVLPVPFSNTLCAPANGCLSEPTYRRSCACCDAVWLLQITEHINKTQLAGGVSTRPQ